MTTSSFSITAALGPVRSRSSASINAGSANWSSDPVDFIGRHTRDLIKASRETLADYVGTGHDNLVFVPNATFGINVVARSLKLQPGDEILTTNHEYGAVNNTWTFNCQHTGAKYINHPIDLPVTTPEEFVERLWEGVTPRTRVITFSHITSPTALIFPAELICRRAKAEGIITVIDGAHAPGQIDLDLEAMGVDYYTGNCHKWLCAPRVRRFSMPLRGATHCWSRWSFRTDGPIRAPAPNFWTILPGPARWTPPPI